jgi:hypothetical protein
MRSKVSHNHILLAANDRVIAVDEILIEMPGPQCIGLPTKTQIDLKYHYFHLVRRKPLFSHTVKRGKNGINSVRTHDIPE